MKQKSFKKKTLQILNVTKQEKQILTWKT